MDTGINLGQLIEQVEALKARVESGELSPETPVLRGDAEWGPRPVRDIRVTKVRDNKLWNGREDDTHWEREDWNDTDEPGENNWADVVLFANLP